MYRLVFLFLAGLAALVGCRSRQAGIRETEILYLSPTTRPEIWRVSATGGSPRQMTDTGGGVYDYTVRADGNQVVFAAKNDQGGLDLWEMGREGEDAKVILPCQVDWCFGAAISPDGARIAYVRRQLASSDSPSPGPPRIWLLDTRTGATDLLSPDPSIRGAQLAWSPNGAYLSFYDEAAGIHVVDMEKKQDFLLPADSSPAGAWSPDSQKLIFTGSVASDHGPESRVYFAEIETQRIDLAPVPVQEGVEYSSPAWSPAGNWLALAIGSGTGSAGKQIWVMGLDGSGLTPVTEDMLVTNAAVSWSPAGDRLVFQRLALGSSDSLPSVAAWGSGDGRLVTVAEDAFSPRWLP